MPDISSVLLEVIRDILDHQVVRDLVICLELTKINQLRQAGIRLVLPGLVDLPLHLNLVGVIISEARIVLGIPVCLLNAWISQILLR